MKCLLWFGVGLALILTVATPRAEGQAQVDPTVQQTNWAQTATVDLKALRQYLQAQDWRSADAETRRIVQGFVHPRGDIYGEPVPTLLPPEVVQSLDRLWAEASGGRFGFRAQAQIWAEISAQNPTDSTVAAKAFGDLVGWTRPVPDYENYISPEWLTQRELTYSLEAPVGHLPWAGIDWGQIERLLGEQSCGSCTVDAVYLQGERFGRYLPLFFHWAQTALDLPVPATGSWQQPRLAATIDLRSLYPGSQCPISSPASAFSPDGTVMAISSYSSDLGCSPPDNSTLALWNVPAGTRRITLVRGWAVEQSSTPGLSPAPDAQNQPVMGDVVNAVAFTPDSRWIVAGLTDGTVRIWRTDTGQAIRTLHGHRHGVGAIALSPDGQTLVTASADQTLKVWNLPTGQLLRTIPLTANDGLIQNLRISPDGQRLATVTNRNTIQLWEVATGRLIRTLVNGATTLYQPIPVAFSPNGQTLATSDSDHSLKLWDARTGARQLTLKGHSEPILSLAFSPDGQILATSDRQSAHLWNLQTHTTVHTLTLNQNAGHPIQPTNLGLLAFSPDGQTLATSSLLLPLMDSEPIPRQGVTLWSVATGQPLWLLHDVGQFQFSPGGPMLMAQGQRVQLWRPYHSLVQGLP